MKKTFLLAFLVAVITVASALLFFQPILMRTEVRAPAEGSGGPIKSTFYKKVPRLQLQFMEGTKEEEVHEWLKRYEVLILKYDAETGVAEIALTNSAQNIIEVKEQISAERNPSLTSVTLIE